LDLECLATATSSGHLLVVQWLAQEIDRDTQALVATDNVPRVYLLRLMAIARGGHLDAIEWLHAQDFSWLDLLQGTSAMFVAAQRGYLAVAKWLLAKDLFGDEGRIMGMDAAAARGSLKMLRWMHQTGRFTVSRSTMAKAASSGHLSIVKYIHNLQRRTDLHR